MNELEIKSVCEQFALKGEFISFQTVDSGHIHQTYQVFFSQNGRVFDYVLQKVNTYVFREPIKVMENVTEVTGFLRERNRKDKAVLQYFKTPNGDDYVWVKDEFWRCCRYIPNSMCVETTEDLRVIEETGRAFGDFQNALVDYPVERLHIVIPHFHNTQMRYHAFREAIASDVMGRARSVTSWIEGYLAFEEEATRLYRLQKSGDLPLRVTHNDTKLSNVLFDKNTQEYLSVIDLDTVMPGLIAFDFGDAVRVIASTGEEDEQDLGKVAVDMKKYEAFARGFVGALKNGLTEKEKETLSGGALTMTVECGMRFLTDYLNGDTYFKIRYPQQNLARAKCHLILAQDMQKKAVELQTIVKKYCS